MVGHSLIVACRIDGQKIIAVAVVPFGFSRPRVLYHIRRDSSVRLP